MTGRPRLECPAHLLPLLSRLRVSEVMERARVSRSVATRWYHEAGVSIRRGRSARRCPAALEPLLGVATDVHIAGLAGCNVKIVRRWREERGIARPRGRPPATPRS